MKFPVMIAAVLMAVPSLADDTIDCKNALTQFDMNQCAEKDYQAADKKLNEVYKKVVAVQEGDAAKLKAAQRAWIGFRDAQCTFETADSEGGSIQPLEYSMCLTKLTAARAKQFNDYLACQKDAAKCE
jgi:uncharacterized protein YecT (DUF1311 family)